MWPRATNPENWLPQSQFIKVISTVRIGRTGGSEIHERVAQLFVVVHSQHNGTYTRNVHPATPTKKPAQILRFAESKKEPLSRKILGKAAQNAVGKGTGPSNLPDTAVGIFLSRL